MGGSHSTQHLGECWTPRKRWVLGADRARGREKDLLATELLGASKSPSGVEWVRRISGYAFITGLVITWIAQSEVAQLVEVTDFDRPYLITYINHSTGVLLAPAQCLFLALLGRRAESPCAELAEGRPWPHLAAALLSVSALFQLADWVWYLGLSHTSVADATIIFNSMSGIVFLLEWLRRKEEMTLWKATAVAASFAGVVCVTELRVPGGVGATDEGGCMGRTWGNLSVFLAACLYAVYQIAVDQVVAGRGVAVSNVLVSLQGLATLLVLWPGVLLLSYLPPTCCMWEQLSWPSVADTWSLLAACSLALAFNVFFCLAIVTASPLLTSVGCMLTIPASLVADLVLHSDPISPLVVLGSGLVLSGFLMIAVPQHRAQVGDGGRRN